jgi:hypothetical protein
MRSCGWVLFFAGVATVLAFDAKEAEKSFKEGLRFEQQSQWKDA